jgi:glucose/arabinose dehydrogenase
MLLAGTFGTLVLAALPAAAQQSPAPAAGAAPTPPPSWAQGRPTGEGAMKLAPVAPPPIPTAADKLPDIAGKLKLQKGFNIEVYASGVANARSMRQGDKGTIFVGSRLQDKVHAMVDKGGKREVKGRASGLHRPNGLAFKDGTLYIAELSKVSKIEKIEDNLDNPAKPVMIYDNLPKDEAARLEVHRHRPGQQALCPDRRALQQLPAARHACTDPPHQSGWQRHGGDCQGVRNTVGFDWHPVSKEL